MKFSNAISFLNKLMKNNKFIIGVLIIIILVIFYFNPNALGGLRETLENNSYTYYGENGSYVTVSTDSSGNTTLIVYDSNGNKTIYTKGTTANIYVADNGSTAEIKTDANGNKTVVVTTSDGTKTVYYNKNVDYDYSSNNNYDNYNHYNGNFENVIFYGPNGGTAQVVKTPDENTIVITYKNGITEIYYIDDAYTSSETYTGPNGNTAKITTNSSGKKVVEITLTDGSKTYYYSGDSAMNNPTSGEINNYNAYNVNSSSYVGPNGNSATAYTGPNGNTAVATNTNTSANSQYYNSLPEGINKWEIPQGEEDKYILKSQVVPPVCPKCPDVQCSTEFDESKCRPCPACERCPEPSFTCEKVPNYNAFNPKTMPLPVLTDFSSFGM